MVSAGVEAFDGRNLWISSLFSSGGHGRVTEIDSADGSLVRVLGVFNGPSNLIFDGNHVWAANVNDRSLTEINSGDGSLVRTLSGGAFGFDFDWANPAGVAYDGTYVWVTNPLDDSITKIKA